MTYEAQKFIDDTARHRAPPALVVAFAEHSAPQWPRAQATLKRRPATFSSLLRTARERLAPRAKGVPAHPGGSRCVRG